MSRRNCMNTRVTRWMVAIAAILVVTGLLPVAATAQPPEAKVIMDGMVDAQIIKIADYAFLAVAYDVDNNVLYFAAEDGEHFQPAMKGVFRVPVAMINVVNVISNSDAAIRDGKRIDLETGFDDSASGDFERASLGCTVKLVAKDPDFGSAELGEGVVTDGKFAVAYEELEIGPTKEVDIGFFMCDHARNLQREFEKLRHEVKKGQ